MLTIEPHKAEPNSFGECKHQMPLWGFCRECKRYDPYPDQDGSWGIEKIIQFNTTNN